MVTPVIDVIDDTTLEFHYGSAKHTSVGGFDCNLQFNWHSIPDRENKRRKDEVWEWVAGALMCQQGCQGVSVAKWLELSPCRCMVPGYGQRF